MLPKHFYKLCFLMLFLLGTLLACSVSFHSPFSSSTPDPSSTQSLSSAPLNQWITASSGVQIRYEDWKSPGNNEDIVTIARCDPSKVHFTVGYRPTTPLSLDVWMQQEKATAIINGGYFDQNNQAEGLVVSDGQTNGTSYDGFGGMFSVDAQGNVKLRSLSQEPFQSGAEQLQQATQSSPMLIINGKRTQFSANAASQRRTVIAQDTQGRYLFIVSPGSAFSLDELADILVSSDLSIKNALNLDGGASTGMYLNAGSQHVAINSVTTLPIVIIVK